MFVLIFLTENTSYTAGLQATISSALGRVFKSYGSGWFYINVVFNFRIADNISIAGLNSPIADNLYTSTHPVFSSLIAEIINLAYVQLADSCN
jgi:hypothetical protein